MRASANMGWTSGLRSQNAFRILAPTEKANPPKGGDAKLPVYGSMPTIAELPDRHFDDLSSFASSHADPGVGAAALVFSGSDLFNSHRLGLQALLSVTASPTETGLNGDKD